MENETKIKSSPKDVFMHLFAIILLYVSAGSFLTVVFQLINYKFPDQLNNFFGSGPIRWAIASLVVIFPIFLWASRFLESDIARNPEKGDLRIRKWLLYFTLFAAAGFIIGDLVTLIFNFLEGELTVRFLLKILAVLLVAACVFGYYLYSLRKKPGEFSKRAKIFVWAVIAVVAVAVIGGFISAGSPFKQRLLRFDGQRLADLQTLQSQIVNYWTQKNRLPAALDDLRDSISGFIPPVDPETGAPYTFRTTGNLSFELCARFNLSSKDNTLYKERYAYPVPVGPYGEPTLDNWDHGVGEHCFLRTIDPELYGKDVNVPRKF